MDQGMSVEVNGNWAVVQTAVGGTGCLQIRLGMINPFHCNIITLFVIQTMPTDGSDLTICTDEIFDASYVVGEAHVLERVHVVHQPVC